MVVLGLDIGKKRIGVARWSPKSRIVTPLTVIQVTKPIAAFREIEALVNEHTPVALILGYPLMPNGHPGELANLVNMWATKLRDQLQVPISLWDERMTSKLAEQDLKALGIAQKEQRSVVDMAAAMRILESWLKAKGHLE